jgi:hypothetical protein
MYNVGFSLIPSAYHGIQMVREKTGFLKGKKEVKGDFNPEVLSKIEGFIQARIPQARISAIIENDIAQIEFSAKVVRYQDNFQITVSPLLLMDDDMLCFSLQRAISHVINEDSLNYSKANLVHSLVCGLGLGCFLPAYVAAPLTCCFNYSYGAFKHKKQELKADQDAVKFCNRSQIRGGLRLFKLMIAIYRVAEVIKTENPSYENLKKLIKNKIEPTSSSHPLYSVRIKLLEMSLIKKDINPKLSFEEISNLAVIGKEFFRAVLLNERKEGNRNFSQEEQLALENLSEFIAFDLQYADLSRS